MVVVLFKTQLRKEAAGPEYQKTAMRMMELASGMPGFISFKTFSAPDGDSVSIVRWGSEEALNAWRNHPEHVKAQQRGREFFYQSYEVQVCRVIREYGFTRDEALSGKERTEG